MRVRGQDALGDYRFGEGPREFLVDSPAEVAQRIKTRLLLMRGEWFLDKTDGTPWATEILGEHTRPFYDLAIQERVLRTPGVTAINNYQSEFNGATRVLTVSMRVTTLFGPTSIELPL